MITQNHKLKHVEAAYKVDLNTIRRAKLMRAFVITCSIAIAVFIGVKCFGIYTNLNNKFDELAKVAESEKVKAYNQGKEEGIAIGKTMLEKLSNKPFKPTLLMSPEQNKLVLKLAVYGESRGEKPIDRETVAWSIINRALDKRSSSIYRNSLAAVIAADGQYDGVTPYLGIISGIVWGDNLDYIPKSARTKGTKDNMAWVEISNTVDDLLDGKLSRKTLANHFYSPSAAKNNEFPAYLKYLKPLAPAGRHLMYVDYVEKDGKVIYFTKDNPYDPLKHD